MQTVKVEVLRHDEHGEIVLTTFKQADGTFFTLKHKSLFPMTGANDARK